MCNVTSVSDRVPRHLECYKRLMSVAAPHLFLTNYPQGIRAFSTVLPFIDVPEEYIGKPRPFPLEFEAPVLVNPWVAEYQVPGYPYPYP